MKKLKLIYKTLIILLIVSACTEERDLDFLDSIPAPTNVAAVYNIAQDNSGLVTITPTAEGATSFDVYFGDTTVAPEHVEAGEIVQHVYTEGTFQVKVAANNNKGDVTEVTQELVVSFQAPQNLVVTVANDIAVSKKVNVNITADFATTYEFYSGEADVAQPVATANIADQLSYQYANPGTYAVKVIAKGGAIETTEYTMDFEVTEILSPITNPNTPQARADEDVISIFSDAYTDVAGTDFNPNWSQQTVYTTFDVEGNAMIQYSNLNYQGIQIGATQDVSEMEYLHLDVWTADATQIDTYLISLASGENAVTSTLTQDGWTSIDIPVSDFTDQGLSVNDIHQFKFTGAGTVFIDNLYFYKASANSGLFDDGLLTNGDFESGSASWLVGVDDASAAPTATADGNTYYSADIQSAGNSYDVNASQKVAITQGGTYTLTFDAWCSKSRAIIAGIGLSAAPWTNATESVNITTTRATYTITLSASEFGATDARVLFDLGADTGVVNIDNVSLTSN